MMNNLANPTFIRHVIESSSKSFRKDCIEDGVQDRIEIIKDTYAYIK